MLSYYPTGRILQGEKEKQRERGGKRRTDSSEERQNMEKRKEREAEIRKGENKEDNEKLERMSWEGQGRR